MSNQEILKKFLLLFVSLMFFAALTIPIYFLMTAGAKKDSPDTALMQSAPEEIALEDAVPGMMGNTQALTEVDILKDTTFSLHPGAFFAGFTLIIVLYIVYYLAVLRAQFYPFLAESNPKMLVFGLLPFLVFMVAELMEILLIPTHLTKRVASFTGLSFEIAYALLAFFIFFTLIGTWLDTNLNRIIMMDGVPFRYTRFGRGPRNLVLIAGLNMRTLKGAGLSLAWMYRIFTKEYTVYVMDKKDEVPEGVTLEDLAEDVYTAMEEIGLISADVVGVSQGGMIAQYLTLNHPDMVDKLVLAVTACSLNEITTNFLNRAIINAKKGQMEKINEECFRDDFTPEYTAKLKPVLPLLVKAGIPKSNTRFIRLAESIKTLDLGDRITEITCPVFVIGAGKDKTVGEQGPAEIAEKLNCKKYIYRHYGHGVYTEANDFNDRILDFLIRN